MKLLLANKLKPQGCSPLAPMTESIVSPFCWRLNCSYYPIQTNKSLLCWPSIFPNLSPTLTLPKPLKSTPPRSPPVVLRSEEGRQITHAISAFVHFATSQVDINKEWVLEQSCCLIQISIRHSMKAVVSRITPSVGRLSAVDADITGLIAKHKWPQHKIDEAAAFWERARLFFHSAAVLVQSGFIGFAGNVKVTTSDLLVNKAHLGSRSVPAIIGDVRWK